MNLAKAFLPEAVEVLGKFYKIHTGHSFWFRFSQLLNEDKLFLHDVDFLYDGEIPEDRQAGFDALCKFFYEKKEIPRCEGGENILDYDIDAELLYAGILQCYGIDLFDEQYHWHKVRAMIVGLHGTKLNEVFGIRSWSDTKNKEAMKLKREWALPEKENKEAIDFFDKFGA